VRILLFKSGEIEKKRDEDDVEMEDTEKKGPEPK